MPPDDELRHCLTVVSGYLGLLHDDPGALGPEQRQWLERATAAAGRAIALCDLPAAPSALVAPPGAARLGPPGPVSPPPTAA